MKRSRLVSVIVLLMVSTLLLLAGCGKQAATVPDTASADSQADTCIEVPNTDGSFARVKEAGVLRVGAVDGLLPYSSSDPQWPGFELEMVSYVAEQLCVKMEPVFVSWDGLIPGLKSERFDVIFDGLFITDERMQEIDFSFPYYASGETILVPTGNPQGIKGIEDLKGKNVGVLSGSVTVQTLEEYGITDLTIYSEQNQIIIELSNGRLEAGYLEAPSAAWVLKQDPSLRVEVVTEYVPAERWNAGAGFRKTDRDLREAVNMALARLIVRDVRGPIFEKYGVPYFESK